MNKRTVNLRGIRLFFVRKFVALNWKNISLTFGKVLFASIIACGAAFALASMLSVNVYLRLLAATIVGVILYALAVKLLRVREVMDVLALLRRKMRRGKA